MWRKFAENLVICAVMYQEEKVLRIIQQYNDIDAGTAEP